MIIQILVTCSIGSCQPIIGDAVNRAKEIKEKSVLVTPKDLAMYTTDGYGYSIILNKNETKETVK